MSEILQDMSKSALVDAIEENFIEWWAQLYRECPSLQTEMYGEPDMVGWITNFPVALLNGVIRAQLTPNNIDANIEAVIARSKSRNVPLIWWVTPTTKPNNLNSYLEQHGFVYEPDMLLVGMALDLLTLNEDLQLPLGLTIEQVQNLDALKSLCHIVNISFEWPDVESDFFTLMSETFKAQLPIYHYIGYLNGKPVASTSYLLGAGIVGLYAVATLPEARRQGIGSAVVLAALRSARAAGCRVAILHAAKMGVGVYRRLGFQEYYDMISYVWKNDE